VARITLRQLLDHAAEHDYGVPAFNINNMEQALAIMAAADATDAPVIIQASRGARSYANDIMLKHMMDAVTEIYPHIPVCVHLDHGNEPGDLHDRDPGRLHLGDDGRLAQGRRQDPGDWDYNVGVTKTVTEMAHLGGISVEGELGVLGSLESGEGEKEDGHGFEGKLSHDQLLTNPEEAVKFVAETKVDALAIAMGTSHGAYKFTRKPDGAILAMNVIEEIHKKLPNMHLVMHGSSSVPQDLQDIINQYGGKMPQTWGVPVEEIQRGIKHGVRKINIDTDNRMAMTGQIRKILTENPGEFDPRKYLKPAMEAMTKLCTLRLKEFNTAGQASKIKRIATTAEMAKRYAKGELDPTLAAMVARRRPDSPDRLRHGSRISAASPLVRDDGVFPSKTIAAVRSSTT
jgi:fructose-bisphosphate aldolase class II